MSGMCDGSGICDLAEIFEGLMERLSPSDVLFNQMPHIPQKLKVLHEGKLKHISELEDGKYIPTDRKYLFSTPPIVDKDELQARIEELRYENPEVIGPFKHLNLVSKD